MSEPSIEVLYEPVLLTSDQEGISYQAGAFRDESDAQAVLGIWRAEGHREPMAINAVTVYADVDDWWRNS